MKKTKIVVVLLGALLIGTIGFFIIRKPAEIQTIDSRSLIEIAKAFAYGGNDSFGDSVFELIDELDTTSSITREGTDADQRPIFVNAQADFEKAIVYCIKCKQIIKCISIIHTPTPATPLCTEGEIFPGLVDSAIQNDLERLLTVKKRPDIIREYLRAGGSLVTTYPKEGRRLRSPEQLRVLDDLVQSYPNHLHAIELDCDAIPQDLIGATYIITFADFSTYILSLRSYQANSPSDDTWGIWFGSIDDPVIADRFQAVISFLKDHGFALPSTLAQDPLLCTNK
ncbi:conserved hypothetical protein [Chlamydia pneumoniae LPCoLN]|uniref:Uncharacterized protein n=2 Tax=Chlamydia pneumoniae TaxID=83558 RepID=D8VEG2_CHLPN|nr:hypothetical protein [Chlamydia pneumoniae]ACZ33148.1 conserved hypothetical protein [Chlamydia pneumoniae LPCoLN]ADI88790.1 hypothetical protein [Chlamydia pneumoniae]ETR80047.1 hypothetical protein X556_0624 [Chlamydia pneumoniae B21]